MFYSILLLIGLILLTLGLVKLNYSISQIRNGKKTDAVVIEIEKTIEHKGKRRYRPIFKYKTDDNQEFIYRHIITSGGSFGDRPIKYPDWSIGQEAKIIYDPSDPHKAILVTYFSLFNWPIILLAMATPCLVVGGGYHLAKIFIPEI